MYSKNDAKVVLFVLIYKQKTGLFDVCLKYIAYLCAFLKNLEMTKAELCKSISAKTGCDALTVLAVVESLMVEVKEWLFAKDNHKSESENGSLLWFFLTWAFALLYFNSFQ